MDYKLTLLDNYKVASGIGFELNVKLDIFRTGEAQPLAEVSKAFRFQINASDAAITQAIMDWYESMKDIYSERIAKQDAAARLSALQTAIDRTETV